MSEIKNGTRILLTEEDATVFVAFKRNREKFIVLLKAGAFDLDSGRVEVNYNNGQIQSVHVHKMTYKRDSRQDVLPT